MASEIINTIDLLEYEINDENDIAVETAKEFILRSINLAPLLQQFEDDDFDDFQKTVVLQAMQDIIKVIRNYEGETV